MSGSLCLCAKSCGLDVFLCVCCVCGLSVVGVLGSRVKTVVFGSV